MVGNDRNRQPASLPETAEEQKLKVFPGTHPPHSPHCDCVPERARILLLGVNHKTAELALRECLAFRDEESKDALAGLRAAPGIEELVLISTCNRTEFLITTHESEAAVAAIKRYLEETRGVAGGQFEQALYIHQGDSAVRHLFRVASGLDSMMLGEPQILGQIKAAYRLATVQKSSGVILNRLLHKTFFTAKRVRTETGIGDHAVSISYAAIELGRKIFGSLEQKRVLLVGAGEMAELAVEHLIRHRAGDIYVANRTFERGMDLARRFNGQAIHFQEIGDYLEKAEIVISSTGAPGYVITREQVKGMMRRRKNRPIFFIDIAVPRDIDPKINRLHSAYVYDIDDLKGVIEENIADRQKEAMRAERIIDEAVIRYRQWYDSLNAVPTIKALHRKMEAIAESELSKTLGSLSHLPEPDRAAIRRMTDALINKVLHDPTLFLKKNGCRPDRSQELDLARRLFNLDTEP